LALIKQWTTPIQKSNFKSANTSADGISQQMEKYETVTRYW